MSFCMTCLHVTIQDQGFPTWMLEGVVMYCSGHSKNIHDGAKTILK
jgi:hypothetical protein